ncbi:MAG: rhodanese-like domain-containing protein [Mariprofundaceae bacterium]|nr:rhodanese-like domain-containing protein [Mariprofundaceae bacterium]
MTDMAGIIFTGLAAVFVALVVWMRWLAPKMAGVRTISLDQYRQHFKKEKHVFIDVRSESEYAAGHIPRARNIPLDTIAREPDNIRKQIPDDRALVLICASGNRSAVAATALARAGFSPVYNISGGMSAWKSAGLALQREKQS